MPTKPWTTFYRPDDHQKYLVLLTELPLRRFRDLSGFMGYTFRIISQLKSTSGVVGYSFLGRFFQRRFRTLSVWEDEAALRAFVRQTPHLAAMKAMQGKMTKTRFIRWRIRGSEYPPRWSEALSRQSET
jgi:quinol monooxygenase YgiN